jgi:signal transduction histidine kinase
MKFTFPGKFAFFDMLALARRGEFDPMAFRGQIELDFSALTFAGPGAMACIKALLAQEQRTLPADVCFPIQHKCQEAIRYLTRMDFFNADIRWCMSPKEDAFIRHSAAGRFLPIRNLHHLHETDAASRDIVACLDCNDRPSAQIFQYAASELIDNALQHSDAPNGTFVTAQKYQKLERIHALIVDTGIGIRRHLRRHPRFQNIGDDVAAIQTALKPFVTGTYLANAQDNRREYENQGLGLSVINEIARRSGGELYVWSGRALYRSRSGVETMPVEWPGTVVFLTLPIKLAVNVTDVVKGFDAALQKPKIQLKFNQ